MIPTPSTPSHSAARWIGISSALTITSALLMWLEPPWAFRALGSLLGWLGIVGLVYGFSISRPRPDSSMTLGEKIAMVSFVATAAIGGYLFDTLQSLNWDFDVKSGLLTKVVVGMVFIAIVESVFIDILRRRESAVVKEDERDASIRARAASYAHTILLILLISFVVQIGFGAKWVGLTSPVAIAHALICIMLASELVRHATEVWLYWRDRR